MGRVVCFGETLLRLTTPGHQAFLQSPSLELYVGGAETNVAVSMARFGHDASLVTTLPEGPIGEAVASEVKRHGVDAVHIRFATGRMGLYYVISGGSLRPSEIVYDRAHSAFAESAPDIYDWERILKGAKWLHLSGITPALGLNGAQAAQTAADAARRMDVAVSFDGNYRAKLWAASGGNAPSILSRLMEAADLAFIDDRDIAVILGKSSDGAGHLERRRLAATAAFAAFPNLKRIASTLRVTSGVQRHRLSAVMFTRAREFTARQYDLEDVVDRIGGGDAFAAGVLHGLHSNMDEQTALEFGLAAACLKHSYPGDFNLARVGDVTEFLGSAGADIRR